MDLRTQLKSDLISSMKAGSKPRTETLRMIISAVDYGKNNPTQPITSEQAVASYRKNLQKAYELAPTPALLEEISVVSEYVPQEPSLTDLLSMAIVIAEGGVKNKGLVIKALKEQFPSASGKLLSDASDQALAAR